MASVGADEDRPPFTADFVEPKTRQRDIVRAYKKGRVDGRWFEYLLPDPHFRDRPQLSGNRLARVTQAFSFSEVDRHISVLLMWANLKSSSLLLSLPDPVNIDVVMDFVQFTAGALADVEMKTLQLRIPGNKGHSTKQKPRNGQCTSAGDDAPPKP
ncbi:hypothetical protein L484_003431 [Morus notabilis]|uniref:Uncharacterized protein n=1 Tax=Morus notabilis TaxID=981085 RepID=W9S4B0_9ROSA|nr:hypothetical protein L484_003431 [Morus notabilis]